MRKIISRRSLTLSGLSAIGLKSALPARLSAQGAPQSATISLPGNPFGITISSDQHWIIVSLSRHDPNLPGSLAVLENLSGDIQIRRIVPMANIPLGITLTHDGKLLIVAAQDRSQNGYVIFFDFETLTTGQGNPRHQIAPGVAYMSTGQRSASINVGVTPDDKTLFVSDESASAISVIDLERLRLTGPDRAFLGKIPVGISPIALTFSPDGRWLYSTSEVASPNWQWPKVLKNENGPGLVSEGAIVVIDVAAARSSPINAVITRVPAGGSPVRLALSPDGRRLFVTARASDAILTFDATKLVIDPQRAKLATTIVGKSPVPISLVNMGKTLIVGNSKRYGLDANTPSNLSVLNTEKIGTSFNPIIASLPTGIFPREMAVPPKGDLLFFANYLSSALQILRVDQIPHS